LGGVGAILTLLGIFSQIASIFHYAFPNSTGISVLSVVVSGLFGVLAIVGFLLFLIAMYGFSKDYNEHRIFSSLLYGIVFTIIAFVVVIVIAVIIIIFNFAIFFPNLGYSTAPQISASFSRTFGLILPLFSLVGVVWIAFVVRAFNLLSDKSKVPLFRTGAKVLLAGALVNVVIAVIFGIVGFYVVLSINTLLALLNIGSLVQNVAWILLAMGYFRIQAPAAPMQATPPINAPPVPRQIKYCPYCGAPNPTDSVYCAHCGQKL
jgi:uncharacterized membrane protein